MVKVNALPNEKWTRYTNIGTTLAEQRTNFLSIVDTSVMFCGHPFPKSGHRGVFICLNTSLYTVSVSYNSMHMQGALH